MQDGWDRRRVLQAGLATSMAWTVAGHAPAWADEVEDFPMEDLFLEDIEPPTARSRGKRSLNHWPRWDKTTPRPEGVWAPDGTSMDTLHLGDAFSDATFEVTGDVMRAALAASAIDIAPLGAKILFGVRAAELVNASEFADNSTFRPTLVLRETSPDHYHRRCLVGVWDPATDQFWAGMGSTVPNVSYMYGQGHAKTQDNISNLLPAGVYDYQVGTHRNGANSRQPGAFRLASPVAIIRINEFRTTTSGAEGVGFSAKGRWDFGGPEVSDNIHAAWRFRSTSPQFSSAGCQVLEGWVEQGKFHRGSWRHFRIAAGLKPDPVLSQLPGKSERFVRSDEDGTPFSYVLLPSRELRLAADGNVVRKLRRGSTGDAVGKLQRALGLRVTGTFDVKTQRRLILRQRVYEVAADGVFTSGRAAGLGLPADLLG